jgi:hypothetical protein
MITSWILDGQTPGSVPAAGAELLVELKLQSHGGSRFTLDGAGGGGYDLACGQLTPTEIFDPGNCWVSGAFTAPSDGVYEFVVEGVDLKQLMNTMSVPNDPFGFGVLINDTFAYYSPRPIPAEATPGGTTDTSFSRHFRIQLELLEGDTCKLISLLKWASFHNLHPNYTDAHAGPADSKIRIYKCTIS